MIYFPKYLKQAQIYSDDEIRQLLNVMTNEEVLSRFRKSSAARDAAGALCFETQITVRAGETRALKISDLCLEPGRESAHIHAFIRYQRNKEGKGEYIYRPITKAKSRKGDRTPALSDFAVPLLSVATSIPKTNPTKKQAENPLKMGILNFFI